jgi:hypothetical protein
MNVRHLLFAVILAAAAGPAAGQQTTPAATAAGAQGTASIPDFTGIWRHGNLPWLIPPPSGPGPVTNLSRNDQGTSNYGELVGDYKNSILQPWAAEVVKKKGELSLAGVTFPSPSNMCWPEPVPYLFKHMAMEMLQLPDRIVMLFSEDHEVRFVRMNDKHPANVTPSWHGDAIGYYEGDTLVVDTVGIKAERPYAMIDLFGTPFTDKMHVVERYRLRDYADVKDAMQRGVKENWRPAGPYRADYKDKYLQIDFTVDDPGTFTTPWSATMIYLRDRNEWPEAACAEGSFGFHHNQEAVLPQAAKPDF